MKEVIKPESVVMLRLVPLGLAVQRENAGILVNRKLLRLEIWMEGDDGIGGAWDRSGAFHFAGGNRGDRANRRWQMISAVIGVTAYLQKSLLPEENNQ